MILNHAYFCFHVHVNHNENQKAYDVLPPPKKKKKKKKKKNTITMKIWFHSKRVVRHFF